MVLQEDLDELSIILERGLRKRNAKKSSPSTGSSREKPPTHSHSTTWKFPAKTNRKAIIVEYTSSSDELSDALNSSSSSSADGTRHEPVRNYSIKSGSISKGPFNCTEEDGFLSIGRGSLNSREKQKLSQLLSKKFRSQSADAVLMAEQARHAKKTEEPPSQTKSSKSVRWKPGDKLESHRPQKKSIETVAQPGEKSRDEIQSEVEVLKKQHRDEIAELTSRNKEELLQTQRNAEEKYESLRSTLDLLEAKVAQAMITSARLHSVSAEKDQGAQGYPESPTDCGIETLPSASEASDRPGSTLESVTDELTETRNSFARRLTTVNQEFERKYAELKLEMKEAREAFAASTDILKNETGLTLKEKDAVIQRLQELLQACNLRESEANTRWEVEKAELTSAAEIRGREDGIRSQEARIAEIKTNLEQKATVIDALQKENHELQVRLESALTEISVRNKQCLADMERVEMSHKEQLADLEERCRRKSMEASQVLTETLVTNLNKQVEEWTNRLQAEKAASERETIVMFEKRLVELSEQVTSERSRITSELHEAKMSNEQLQTELAETRQRLHDAINAETETRNRQFAFKKTTRRKLKELKANHMARLAEMKRQSRAQMEADCKRCEERHLEENARHAEELQAAVDRMQFERKELEEDYEAKLLEASRALEEVRNTCEAAEQQHLKRIRELESALKELREQCEETTKQLQDRHKQEINNLRDALAKEKARTCSAEETLRRRELEWLEVDEARQAEEEQRIAQMLPANVQSHLESVINSLRAQVEILRKRAKLLEEANESLINQPRFQGHCRIADGKGTSKLDCPPAVTVETTLGYGDFLPPPPAELLVPLPKGDQASTAGKVE